MPPAFPDNSGQSDERRSALLSIISVSSASSVVISVLCGARQCCALIKTVTPNVSKLCVLGVLCGYSLSFFPRTARTISGSRGRIAEYFSHNL